MSSKELKNKPLVEALLELRWILASQVPQQQVGPQSDPHYRLLLGRFSERIEGDYPFHESLPPSEFPDVMVAHAPQHRFRVSKDSWPLIQIGPGIMTVNETARYTWPDFQKRCVEAVNKLFDAHPARGEFQVQDLTLRYIDAVDVDFDKEDVFSFLRDKMNVNIILPESLFAEDRVRKAPAAFNWQASFPNSDPGGTMTLRFAMGQRKGTPAIIWETMVQAGRDHVPMPSGFKNWLDRAHELTNDWFFKMIEGDLQRRFS